MAEKTNQQIILKAENITKKFPGVTALDSVNLEIVSGRVNAIVGENGAGKSTLMKILSGVYQDYEGRFFIDGQEVSFKNPREAQDHGMAIIHQELNLISHMSVAENIFLGREFINRFGFINYKRLHKESSILLQQLKLDISPTALVSSLRVGQQQLVEIAKALSLDARIIIMDEPTSAISEQEVAVLFDVINNLVKNGVTIVYITHKLDELFKISDFLTVLRDGKFVGTDSIHNLSHDDIVRMMVGRDVQSFFIKNHQTSEEVVLHVDRLSLPHPIHTDKHLLKNIDIDVHKGEVLGIFGLMGAGRTELLETLFGLHPDATGTVRISDQTVEITSPAQAIASGLAFVPEDRKLDGLVLNMNIAQSISLASIGQIDRHGFLSSSLENQLASQYAQKLAIKSPSMQQIVENLSGGNQQKVVLAKWLATQPQVLLLDEPTRGIDINAKNEIYRIINELAQSKLGIVMVSSELPEILAIADRILVLARGRLTGEFMQKEATEEKLLAAAV